MKKEKNNGLLSLNGQNAIIIGGFGLIGSEITKVLLSSGAQVIVLDSTLDKGPKSKDFHQLKFDCADLDNLESSFDLVIEKFGCPDVFINCSYPRTKDWGNSSFNNIKLDSYRNNIDIHLNSYSWLAKLVANKMVLNSIKGSIIQFGSIYGFLGQDLNLYKDTEMKENMTYAIVKGGIINLTRQMASYYGKDGVRVNTICPGGLSDSKQNSKFVNRYNKKVPMGRMGNAYEIAMATLFLASNASSYITGSTLVVDGGLSIV